MGGVFVAAVLLLCFVLWGFVCWNNYQDSREYNFSSKYNTRNSSASSETAEQTRETGLGEDSASSSAPVGSMTPSRLAGGLTTIAECPRDEVV